MAKLLHENQLRRMTAMFVENVSNNLTIAEAIGIANSSVSRYRRAFKGEIPMPPYVGSRLKKFDLLKLYTQHVRPEDEPVIVQSITQGLRPDDDVRLAEINEANRRSGLPVWESHAARDFDEATAELEEIDREIHAVLTPSGLPAWESDAQAVLEKIDPQTSDPIAAAIRELEAERTRLSLAIETLKRLKR